MSLPRLLAGAGAEPMGLERHLRVHGPLPVARPAELMAELERSGLLGRGGAAFPLAAKLRAVMAASGRRAPVVVVNLAEGEPMSFKDRTLAQLVPHLVLDGALCAATLTGAPDVILAVERHATAAIESLRAALAQRTDVGRRGPEVRIAAVGPGYLAGQETALVNQLSNGDPRPTTQPPRVAQRGVARRPTLVSNPETLAHAALIARHGAGWFRELGGREEPGSALVTLSGCVSAPGVYEIELGSHLTALLEAAGGLSQTPRAFLLGGYAGTWADAAAARGLRLSRRGLEPVRAMLGAGVIVALGADACPVAEVARVGAWMADESAGQCGPCVNGLEAIAGALAEICTGGAHRGVFSDLRRWAELVTGRGACAHPDGVAQFVSSALRVFAAEFDDHARHGACEACERPPALAIPASWGSAPAIAEMIR
ncbi:MAG TPA: NADH-ubiquinone oxidoreductase-F iron-sulfur binding region domain-containing protein [Solirubrobacteraceae bacterium]|nr:NADH-ubiquinone oxidoreductase-F iron-sulfur binding region domain-containing protein [Solirubrobacteraceae bacterium]